jgi:hypothetical protein
MIIVDKVAHTFIEMPLMLISFIVARRCFWNFAPFSGAQYSVLRLH